MSNCKSLSSPKPVGGGATNIPDTSAQSHHFVDQRALRTMMGAAAYHARRVARTMGLSDADREDVEQDIMLALLERRRFFDPARGAWSSFADRVARQAAQGAADEIGADRRVRGGSLDEDGIPLWELRTLVPILKKKCGCHARCPGLSRSYQAIYHLSPSLRCKRTATLPRHSGGRAFRAASSIGACEKFAIAWSLAAWWIEACSLPDLLGKSQPLIATSGLRSADAKRCSSATSFSRRPSMQTEKSPSVHCRFRTRGPLGKNRALDRYLIAVGK